MENHKDVVELLLAHGARVNLKTDDGWTPLHYAAQQGYYDIVELLLAKGADVNAKTNNGWTPLGAAESQHRDNVANFCASTAATNKTGARSAWISQRVLCANSAPPREVHLWPACLRDRFYWTKTKTGQDGKSYSSKGRRNILSTKAQATRIGTKSISLRNGLPNERYRCTGSSTTNSTATTPV